jgi:hypothetical protein
MEATMLRGSSLVGVAVALIAAPLMGSPAWGQAPCVSAPVATYETAGFSCTVDGLLFSNFNVNQTVSGGGTVVLGNISPFQAIINGIPEFGLSLDYTAIAPGPGSSADVSWQYNVSTLPGIPGIIDAFLALAGNTVGAGVAQVSEILSNGVNLFLNAPGSTTATFPAVFTLAVLKDQIDFVPTGATGSSTSSIVTNAFSLVPAPIVGAGVPGLVIACGGLLALARRRRRQQIA